ncbi:MAG: hypothetical protein AABW54_04740 [Candidatus Micrarchaeota archaeon]
MQGSQINLSEFKILAPSDEQVVLNAIQGHIAAYLQDKQPNLAVHTILINKIAYYSAIELNLELTRGWYLYGPCIDSYLEREKTFFDLRVAAPVHRRQNPVVIEECEKNIAQYAKTREENDFYAYLSYIYRKRSEYPQLAEMYVAKNDLFRALSKLYSKKEVKENEIVRNFDAFNRALLSNDYQDFISINEVDADAMLDYSFLLMERAIDALENEEARRAFHEPAEEFNNSAFKALSDKHYAATVKSFSEEIAKDRRNSFRKAYANYYHLARQRSDSLKMELVKPMVMELGGRA